jgi:hypothetical protein
MTDGEVAAAAVFEVARYLLIIALIIWVGFSKSLRSYIGAQPPTAAETPVGEEINASGASLK